MFSYVTEDRSEAERTLRDLVVPAINRPLDDLRERLLIGPAEECAAKLRAFSAAGLWRALIWPVRDPVSQLEVFAARVAPLVN
jgi:hypothetical protein